jgi:UDP-N-acetylglucosamine transferase subunit ALG13
VADVVPVNDRQWVTVDGPRSRALRAGGERVSTVATFDSQHLNVRNPLLGILLATRLRPQVIVSSGAGVVLTFVLVSWLLGARVIFIETMARVTTPSRTGRILARISTLHVVQWPELLTRFPRAILCRPVLLPAQVAEVHDGDGTFVSVGTHPDSFDRLLAAVNAALSEGVLPSPCVAQIGPSRWRSQRATTAPDFTPSEFDDHVRAAQYVVGHCGAGLVATALRLGRRPIVMARRAALNEHVDDHQLQLAGKLAALGLVVNVEERIDEAAMRRANEPLDLEGTFSGLTEVHDLLTSYLAPLWWS